METSAMKSARIDGTIDNNRDNNMATVNRETTNGHIITTAVTNNTMLTNYSKDNDNDIVSTSHKPKESHIQLKTHTASNEHMIQQEYNTIRNQASRIISPKILDTTKRKSSFTSPLKHKVLPSNNHDYINYPNYVHVLNTLL